MGFLRLLNARHSLTIRFRAVQEIVRQPCVMIPAMGKSSFPVTLCLLALAAGVGTARAGRRSWARSHITGGPVEEVMPSLASPGTVYLTTLSGDSFVSTDNGESWNALSIPYPLVVVALSPTDPDLLFATARQGPAGLYRSTDRGQTWLLVQPGCAGGTDVFGGNPAIVACTDTAGMFLKSSDSGQTWSPPVSPPTGESFGNIRFKPDDPSTLFSLMYKSLLKSTDSGASWFPSSSGLPIGENYDFDVSRLAPATLLVSTTQHGMFRSTDAGATWAAANIGIAADGNPYSILQEVAINPHNAAQAAVAGNYPGDFYITDFGGRKWTNAQSATTSPLSIDWILTVAFGGTNGLSLFAGSAVNGLWRSDDFGSTWLFRNKGVEAIFADGVCGASAAPGTVYTSDGNALWASTDQGATWTVRSTSIDLYDLNLLEMDPFDASTLWAGTLSGLIVSRDSGATWSVAFGNEPYVDSIAFDRSAPGTLFLAGGGRLWKLTNGGANATNISAEVENRFVQNVVADPARSGRYLVSTNDAMVFLSTDDGVSWSGNVVDPNGYEAFAVAFDPFEPATLYASVLGGGLYRSDDSGATWTRPAAPARGSPNPRSPENVLLNPLVRGEIIADELDDGLRISKNRGATWARLDTGLEGRTVRQLYLDAQNGILYAACVGGVFVDQFETYPVDSLPSGAPAPVTGRR